MVKANIYIWTIAEICVAEWTEQDLWNMEVLCSNTATGIYTIIFFTDSTNERIQFRGNLNEFMQGEKAFF